MLFSKSGPQWRPLMWIQVIALLIAAVSPTAAQSGAGTGSTEDAVVAATAGSSKKPASSSSKSKTTTKKSTSSSSTSKPAAKKSASSSEKSTPPAPPVPVTTETLPQRLASIANGAGSWGVQVSHVESGKVLFGKGETKHFIPASNRKIFTGALALDQLGAEYKFRTFLYRTGNVDPSGTLQGNLVILPQGDPTFSNRVNGRSSGQHAADWIFRNWVEKVKEAGIKHVSGDILIDASDWVWNDLHPTGWPSRLIQDSYAVIPSPLTINENLMGIKVRPGAAGTPPKIEFFPPADGYPVKLTAVSGGEGSARIVRPATGPIEISGTVGKFTETAKPSDNPTLFAAAVFRHRLREAGINLGGTARIIMNRNVVPAPVSDTVIAYYDSPSMADMVKTMMKQSNNHFAEQLFVAVSAAKTGKGGYTESRRLENELLKKAGVDVRNVQFGDGCGLSESNQVTPEQTSKLLSYMLNHPTAQAFVDSMAIGGVDGTLRGRMQSEGLKGKVYAKTGFINQVSALSGYYFKAPGETFIFSILVNNIPGGPGGARAGQEQVLQVLSRLEM